MLYLLISIENTKLIISSMTEKNIFSKSLSWFANNTYRKIPTIIENFQNKPIQNHHLTYQSLNCFPKNAKNIGFDVIRRAHKTKYHQQKDGHQKHKKHSIVQKFIAQKSDDYQKPIQLVCPICMDFFSGPVSTTCGHTFCLQCLDQAILFNANCPMCRNQIRGEQLIICKSIQTLILSFFYKFQDQFFQQAFQKRQEEFQTWTSGRNLDKNTIDQDDQIDVRDTEFVWCRAKIMKIYQKQQKNNSIMVHYQGWSQTYDQIISLSSQRLATLGFYTNRKQIPHYNLNNENHSHMYSYVVIQRNMFQYNPPFNAFQLDEEQDQLRTNNWRQFNLQRGWGIRNNLMFNQRDEIIEQSSDLDVTFRQDENPQNIINQASQTLSIMSRSSSDTDSGISIVSEATESQNQAVHRYRYQHQIRPLRSIESYFQCQTEPHLYQNRHIFSDIQVSPDLTLTNSLVNISVQWSDGQQSQDVFHHNRFVQGHSMQSKPQIQISKEQISNLNDGQNQNQNFIQNQDLISLIGKINQDTENHDLQKSYQQYVMDIWSDWTKYKISNGLLVCENQHRTGSNQNQKQEHQNYQKSFNNQSSNSNSNSSLSSNYFSHNPQQQLQIQSQEQDILQHQKRYEYTTFRQLCEQFDKQLKSEFDQDKMLFSFQLQPYQSFNPQTQEKTRYRIKDRKLQQEKKLTDLFKFQYDKNHEDLEKLQKQQPMSLPMQMHMVDHRQKDESCQQQLNKEISNFINKLVQTAQQSYNRQDNQSKN